MSAREAIFEALDIVFEAVEDVERYERMPSGDPDKFPALSLYEDGQRVLELETGSDRFGISCTIEGYMSGTADVHGELNALHARTIAALMADRTLGGIVETIELGGLRIDVAELASKRRLGFAQDFEVQFATPSGDPFNIA